MYQYTVIVGNLGRDPEMRYTKSGSAVCDFSVAVTRRWTDSHTNEQREKTTWFRVSAWNKLGEACNQYLKKGNRVLVTGEIEASAWVNDAGEAKASLELTARDVKFLTPKGQGGSAPQDADEYEEHSLPSGEANLSDIPF